MLVEVDEKRGEETIIVHKVYLKGWVGWLGGGGAQSKIPFGRFCLCRYRKSGTKGIGHRKISDVSPRVGTYKFSHLTKIFELWPIRIL